MSSADDFKTYFNDQPHWGWLGVAVLVSNLITCCLFLCYIRRKNELIETLLTENARLTSEITLQERLHILKYNHMYGSSADLSNNSEALMVPASGIFRSAAKSSERLSEIGNDLDIKEEITISGHSEECEYKSYFYGNGI